MKVYVYNYLEKVSDSYHSGGGIVVFAKNLTRVKQLAKENGLIIQDGEKPDDVRVLIASKQQEAIYIMPDAGCC